MRRRGRRIVAWGSTSGFVGVIAGALGALYSIDQGCGVLIGVAFGLAALGIAGAVTGVLGLMIYGLAHLHAWAERGE